MGDSQAQKGRRFMPLQRLRRVQRRRRRRRRWETGRAGPRAPQARKRRTGGPGPTAARQHPARRPGRWPEPAVTTSVPRELRRSTRCSRPSRRSSVPAAWSTSSRRSSAQHSGCSTRRARLSQVPAQRSWRLLSGGGRRAPRQAADPLQRTPKPGLRAANSCHGTILGGTVASGILALLACPCLKREFYLVEPGRAPRQHQVHPSTWAPP